jgi:hypothetical protein
LGLFGCAFGRISLFVLTPPLCLFAFQFSRAVGVLTPPRCLLALALTPLFVLEVAVGACGPPTLPNGVADFPQLVQHNPLFRSSEERQKDLTSPGRASAHRDACPARGLTPTKRGDLAVLPPGCGRLSARSGLSRSATRRRLPSVAAGSRRAGRPPAPGRDPRAAAGPVTARHRGS